MSFSKVKSYAKINLALNVTGKLKNLHKIESIVSFVDLHDLIFIKGSNGSGAPRLAADILHQSNAFVSGEAHHVS